MKGSFQLLAVSILVAFPATAQEPPISTDRPSQSAGAGLVPVHSFQLEAGIQWVDSGKEYKFDLGQVLLRYGLSSRFEMRMGLNSSYTVRERGTEDIKGLEDFDVEAKIGLYDSAGETTQVSLLPSLTLPTGDSGVGGDAYVPGLLVLFGHSLGGSFSLTANLGWSRPSSDRQRFDQIEGTLMLSFGLTSRLSGYAEVYAFNREEPDGGSTSHADAGLSYLVAHTFTVDAVVGTGLSGSDSDVFVGVGLGKRW